MHALTELVESRGDVRTACVPDDRTVTGTSDRRSVTIWVMEEHRPAPGAAVAMRLPDGHETVMRVLGVNEPRLHLDPPLVAHDGDAVAVAWVTATGQGFTARGTIVAVEGGATVVDLGAETSLAGRFLRRFVPPHPLHAEATVYDDAGRIRLQTFGDVRDLALTGAGLVIEGLREGDAIMLTISEPGGHAVVEDAHAHVVRVASPPDGTLVGLSFDAPFDEAPAIAAIAAVRDQPA